eukprot:CAMPEP_0194491174 /NCGR_PEP_ID=MMETSP0253-20130528/10146_1 /TAXON_ID=2966 /ORGANISM="Noctiluca scintillans" /LENGTH=78 /DNA_ID=CAMNT_0039331883 /DNA_START=700 /DNA_END=932 /DNA_ORIENTATION=+
MKRSISFIFGSLLKAALLARHSWSCDGAGEISKGPETGGRRCHGEAFGGGHVLRRGEVPRTSCIARRRSPRVSMRLGR